MKKLIVCITLAAFAMMTSLQAGETSTKAAKSSCCEQAKTAATCSGTKMTSACAAKSACSASKVAKRNREVKGAVLLVQR